MHPRTIATLHELESAAWFSRVGVVDTQAVPVLQSWEDAIRHCSSLKWENVQLEASNRFREALFRASPRRFDAWNQVLDTVKPAAVDLVQRKVRNMVLQYGLPDVFEATVRWDIVGVAMEAEYADIYPPPGFFAAQAYWYAHGHFPCGWEGDFPNGRRIIY